MLRKAESSRGALVAKGRDSRVNLTIPLSRCTPRVVGAFVAAGVDHDF